MLSTREVTAGSSLDVRVSTSPLTPRVLCEIARRFYQDIEGTPAEDIDVEIDPYGAVRVVDRKIRYGRDLPSCHGPELHLVGN